MHGLQGLLRKVTITSPPLPELSHCGLGPELGQPKLQHLSAKQDAVQEFILYSVSMSLSTAEEPIAYALLPLQTRTSY